jgi:hypothetical protein
MGRPAREEYLADPCNVCGAKKGERCVDTTGRQLSPSKSHKDRMQVWKVKNEMDDAGQQVAAAEVEAQIEAEDEHERLMLEAREGRIRLVLSAIAFSRKIGTTQDQIDRHLAEMIVDAEFDHAYLEG